MPRRLATLVAGLALLLLPLQGAAAGTQTYPMPGKGKVTISGHGYGHGHGMSQHGAQGAALQGKTWQEIVGFYYPGTSFGKAPRRVRVLISADTTRDVVVRSRPRLFVKDTGTREKWVLPDNGARRWRLNVDGRGRSVVAYHDGGWHRWRTLSGDGFFAAGGPITLVTPAGPRRYRGRLFAARPAPGSHDRDTVNALHINAYLKGVVPQEMPALWEPEAVRAQSVAARTYASYEAAHPRASHYQLCDTTACQVYGGHAAEHPAASAAIRATGRTILTHQGKPAFTQFSASSGGWTSANQFPYLPAQEDPFDDWARSDGSAGNPNHAWQVDVDVARIEGAFGIGDLGEIRVLQRDGNGEWGGRVRQLELVGTGGKVVKVTGDTFRFTLGLRSTWFSFG